MKRLSGIGVMMLVGQLMGQEPQTGCELRAIGNGGWKVMTCQSEATVTRRPRAIELEIIGGTRVTVNFRHIAMVQKTVTGRVVLFMVGGQAMELKAEDYERVRKGMVE